MGQHTMNLFTVGIPYSIAYVFESFQHFLDAECCVDSPGVLGRYREQEIVFKYLTAVVKELVPFVRYCGCEYGYLKAGVL